MPACRLIWYLANARFTPSRRSCARASMGIFMAIFFAGGAAASALVSPVLTRFGWAGICAIGVLLPVLALLYFAVHSVRARDAGIERP